VANNKKITSLPMVASVTKPVYIAPITAEKITKNAVAQSSWFEGQLIFAKDEMGRKVDTHNFQYILTEGPAAKKPNGGPPKEVKSKADEYKEGLRDYQCQMIAKLEGDDAENLYKDVLAANPGYVGAHLAMIQSIETPTGGDLKNQLPNAFIKLLRDPATNVEDIKVKLIKITKLSTLIIEGINHDGLLAFYGLKSDNRPDATKIKQQMDKQKQQLLDAYVKKAVALGKLMLINDQRQETSEATSADELDSLMTDAMKFIDFNDSKYLLLPIWQSYTRQQQGRMLKYLQKLYEDKLQRDVLEEMLAIADTKKWHHICLMLKRTAISANPQGFRVF